MGRDHGAAHAAHSCSSSIDSSNHPPAFLSSSSSAAAAAAASSSSSSIGLTNKNKRDLSTDLKLGLSISPTTSNNNINIDVSSTSTQREQRIDWPPIKSLLRSTLAEKAGVNYQQQHQRQRHASLFVKVYMEGIPIGRKLDLFAHDGYIALVTTLRRMFGTPILSPDDTDRVHNSVHKHHVLTYEDKEGDWMMVGDVPWEMFLTTVRRLKIARADRC